MRKKCWLNLPKISLGNGTRQLSLSQQNLKQNLAGLILELYVGLDCLDQNLENMYHENKPWWEVGGWNLTLVRGGLEKIYRDLVG